MGHEFPSPTAKAMGHPTLRQHGGRMYWAIRHGGRIYSKTHGKPQAPVRLLGGQELFLIGAPRFFFVFLLGAKKNGRNGGARFFSIVVKLVAAI